LEQAWSDLLSCAAIVQSCLYSSDPNFRSSVGEARGPELYVDAIGDWFSQPCSLGGLEFLSGCKQSKLHDDAVVIASSVEINLQAFATTLTSDNRIHPSKR